MGENKRELGAMSQAVAAQLRAERAAAGMTQAEVYTKAGMKRSTYLRIEAGTRVADVMDLAKLTQAFGVKIPTLMERAESRIEKKQSNAKRKAS